MLLTSTLYEERRNRVPGESGWLGRVYLAEIWVDYIHSPEAITANKKPKSFFIEDCSRAKRRLQSTYILLNQLATKINDEKMSFDKATNIANFLAGTLGARKSLHKYIYDKNLIQAAKACLKTPGLTIEQALERISPSVRRT